MGSHSTAEHSGKRRKVLNICREPKDTDKFSAALQTVDSQQAPRVGHTTAGDPYVVYDSANVHAPQSCNEHALAIAEDLWGLPQSQRDAFSKQCFFAVWKQPQSQRWAACAAEPRPSDALLTKVSYSPISLEGKRKGGGRMRMHPAKDPKIDKGMAHYLTVSATATVISLRQGTHPELKAPEEVNLP